MKEYFESLDILKSTMPLDEYKSSSSDILLHTRGIGLDELMRTYRPQLDDKITKYQKSMHFKYTRVPFIKGVDAVVKAINGIGIKFDVQGEVKEALENKSFDLVDFLVSKFQVIIERPNSHLVWMPRNRKINPNFIPLHHPLGIEDDNDTVDFEPIIVNDVLYFDDERTIWEAGTWKFTHDGEEKQEPYYMGVDLSGYYRSIPIGYRDNKIVYSFETYYAPNGGFEIRHTMPLGGDLASIECNGYEKDYFVSFFANAAEYGKDFIISYHDFKQNYKENNYPIRVFNGSACGNCKGSGKSNGGNGSMIDCVQCNGSGQTFTLSPYQDVHRKQNKSRAGHPTETREPFIEYFSSGSELLKFSEEHCFEMLMRKMEESISLNYLRNAQSGKAKEEDKESYYALMTKIVNNYLRLIKFSLVCIVDLVVYNKSQRENVQVNALRSVKNASLEAVISQITEVSASSMPSALKSSFIGSMVGSIKDDYERKITSIMSKNDVLFGKTDAEILQLSVAVNSKITDIDMEFNLRGRKVLCELREKYKTEFLVKSESELYDESVEILKRNGADIIEEK